MLNGSLAVNRVGRDDNQSMRHFVGFDNHFPIGFAMSGLDHEATVHDVVAIARGRVEHRAEVDLVEATVFHSFLDVGCDLELPFPPRWPVHRGTLPRAPPRSTL